MTRGPSFVVVLATSAFLATHSGCTDWERLSRDVGATATSCATYVVAGDVHSCARRANGELLCWGDNRFGQLGVGDGRPGSPPVSIDVGGRATSRVYLPSGNGDPTADLTGFTCAIVEGEDLYCWGDNRFGQLGTGDTQSTARPVRIETLPGKPSRLANGAGHSCAQTIDNTLLCWGKNTSGQLGTGDTKERLRPTVVSVGRPVERLAAAGDFSCARGTDGTLFCFGANASGQLGIGTTEPQAKPAQVTALGTRTGRLAAGAAHACAFTEDDGRVHCWGDNRSGQLGTGDLDRRLTPTEIDPAGLGAVRTNQLFAGGSHTCALRDDNSLWCWGGNRFGQLGTGDTDPRPRPTRVLSGVAAAYAGGQHTCALLIDGAVQCWGSNQYGQLGVDVGARSLVPVTVLPPCK